MANNLTRFSPFGELARFDAFRDFDDFFKRPILGNLVPAQAVPRINLDVTESDQSYVVRAEVPGAKKDDIKVTVEGNTVSIRVESKRNNEERQGETVVHSERYYGVQTRSFSLAHDIDDGKSSARYEDGVLELTLPKRSGPNGAKVLSIQ